MTQQARRPTTYRPRDIVVGAFVLSGLVLILAGIFLIRGMGFGRSVDYRVLYSNVSTIAEGSAVKYHGLLVGRVDGLAIDRDDPSKVRVDISVRRGVPVTTDTVAKITKSDLLGDEYIELRSTGTEPGTAAALRVRGQDIPPGGTVAAGEPFDLGATLERAQEIVELIHDVAVMLQGETEKVFATLGEVTESAQQLVSEDNRRQVESLLADLSGTARAARDLLADNASRIDDIVESAGEATTSVRDAADGLETTLQDLGPELRELVAAARSAVTQVEALSVTLDSTARSADVARLNELLLNLDSASRHLVDLTRKLKERPYLLVRPEKPRTEEDK